MTRRSRLDAVLRVRRLQEERAKGDLLRAQGEQELARAVVRHRRTALAALPAAPSSEVTPERFLLDRTVRAFGAGSVVAAESGARAAAERSDQRRTAWSAAAQRAGAVERLDSRHRKAARAETVRRDQAVADEVAVARWAREVR